mgnify:CR=1 FL=1
MKARKRLFSQVERGAQLERMSPGGAQVERGALSPSKGVPQPAPLESEMKYSSFAFDSPANQSENLSFAAFGGELTAR